MLDGQLWSMDWNCLIHVWHELEGELTNTQSALAESTLLDIGFVFSLQNSQYVQLRQYYCLTEIWEPYLELSDQCRKNTKSYDCINIVNWRTTCSVNFGNGGLPSLQTVVRLHTENEQLTSARSHEVEAHYCWAPFTQAGKVWLKCSLKWSCMGNDWVTCPISTKQ